MAFSKELHITDDQKPHVHPDRWKWESAITYIGMPYNAYQVKRNGHRGKAEEYYRRFRFAMNSKTKGDIVIDDTKSPRVCFVSDEHGLTTGISGIEIRVDDNLPDGRVVLIRGDECVSFDWRGREHWQDRQLVGYTFDEPQLVIEGEG